MARPPAASRWTPRALAAVVLLAVVAVALTVRPPAGTAATAPPDPQDGAIANVAGSGTVFPDPGGFSGDGGPAISARLNHPAHVAALPGGGFLVADSDNHRIRRVGSDGIISTVAGDGRHCPRPTDPCGDGGRATDASLAVPHGVAVLPEGGFVIADTFNNRIRRVTPAGEIETVAGSGRRCEQAEPCGHGGPATQGALSWPTAATPAPGGGLLIADFHAPRIRLLHAGVLLDLAGTGVRGHAGDGGAVLNARFGGIADVQPMPGGGFLVADGDNCRLRRVSATGTVTPFAGSGPTMPCYSHVPFGEGEVGDGGPATAARLNVPGYLAVGERGEVFLTDHYNNRVRRIAADGRIATVAGSGEPVGHGGDGGPAGEARLAWPSGVSLRPGGGVLVTDSGNNRVRLVGDRQARPARIPAHALGARPPVVAGEGPVRLSADGAAPIPLRCPPDPEARGCRGDVVASVGGRPPARGGYDLGPGASAQVPVLLEPGAREAVAGAGAAGLEASLTLETLQPSGDRAVSSASIRLVAPLAPPPPPPPPSEPAGSEPPTLAGNATRPSAFGGTAAWSSLESGPPGPRYRLTIDDGRGPRPARVAPRGVPFDVSVGPDRHGRPVLVYSRCRRDPVVRRSTLGMPAWATGRGCDLYRLDPRTGREARLRGPSTTRGSEFLPALWRDRIAFARVDGPVAAPRVYVRSLRPGARSARAPGGGRPAAGLPGPTGIDLAGRRVAVAWSTEERAAGRTRVVLGTLGGATRTVATTRWDRSVATYLSPRFADGRLRFALQRSRPGAGGAGSSLESTVYRYRITSGTLERARAPHHLTGMAVIGGCEVFSVTRRPFSPAGCADPAAACELCGGAARIFGARAR